MPVTRTELSRALSFHDPEILRALLQAAGVPTWRATTAHELAARITTALWWSYTSPLGFAARNPSLDTIVRHVARRLRLSDSVTSDDAWLALQQLTAALEVRHGPVRVEDLDPRTRRRLRTSWLPPTLWATGSGTSIGAASLGHLLVKIGKGPVGRVLPLLPYVGPLWRVMHRGGQVAAVLGTPMGLSLAVLSVNSALGTNYRRLVPLLLGVGALGASPLDDADEVSEE